MNKNSKELKDTRKIAEEIFNKLKPTSKRATVFGLYGDLGSGKTTFVQFFCKIAGIKRRISSPTFVIMKRYPLKHRSYKNLFHLDAYRLKNENELYHLGWEDIISNPAHLIFIEWPENVLKALPKNHHKIHIFHSPKGSRRFKINKT